MGGEDRTESSDHKPKKDGDKVNALQIAAATGASTTAAVIANMLGVYGTVIGVAVISLVSSVTTVVYARSMHRTKDKVSKVVRNTKNVRYATRASTTATKATSPGSGSASATTATATVRMPMPQEQPTQRLGAAAQESDATMQLSSTDPAETTRLIATGGSAIGRAAVDATTALDEVETADSETADTETKTWWKTWRPVVVTSLIVFVLSIGALSTIALLSGQSANAFYHADPVQNSDNRDSDSDDQQQEEPSSESPSSGESDESDTPSNDENSTSPQDEQPSDQPSQPDDSNDAPTQPSPPAEKPSGDNPNQPNQDDSPQE